MDQYFRISVDTAVELVIRVRSVVNVDFMADYEAGLGLASNNQIAQISIISLDVTLSSTKVQSCLDQHGIYSDPLRILLTFFEQLSKRDEQLSLSTLFVRGTGIRRHVQTRNLEMKH